MDGKSESYSEHWLHGGEVVARRTYEGAMAGIDQQDDTIHRPNVNGNFALNALYEISVN